MIMTKNRKIYLTTCILFTLTLLGAVTGQNINNRNELSKSIKSNILNESRNILIHLPDNYENSNKSYPVMYRLDGDTKLLRETVSIVNRLSHKEEIIPEMIIVAIENTNRNKDMWPVNTKYYPETETAGANDFLDFIETELIPYIENNFRTTQNRIICGQSLSGVFTLYTFLTKPNLFDSYLVSSGAFPDCEQYFKKISNKAFQQIDQYNGQKIFITHGLKDPLDPDGTIHQQMIDFSKSVKDNLGNKISCKYLFYENGGHVPKNSLYDGLKYLFESNVKE